MIRISAFCRPAVQGKCGNYRARVRWAKLSIPLDAVSLPAELRNAQALPATGLACQIGATGHQLNFLEPAFGLGKPEFAEEWLTSAQAMGLAGRTGDVRVMPWDRSAPSPGRAEIRPSVAGTVTSRARSGK